MVFSPLFVSPQAAAVDKRKKTAADLHVTFVYFHIFAYYLCISQVVSASYQVSKC